MELPTYPAGEGDPYILILLFFALYIVIRFPILVSQKKCFNIK